MGWFWGGRLLLLFILQDLVYCALSKCQHCQSNAPIKPNRCCWALPVFISADRRAQSPHTRLHPPIHPFTHPSLITSSHSLVLLCSLSPYRSLCTLLWHILYRCWCFLFRLVCSPAPPKVFFFNHSCLCCSGDFVLRLDLDAPPEELDFSIIRPHVDYSFPPSQQLSGVTVSRCSAAWLFLSALTPSFVGQSRIVTSTPRGRLVLTVACWSCVFLIAF